MLFCVEVLKITAANSTETSVTFTNIVNMDHCENLKSHYVPCMFFLIERYDSKLSQIKFVLTRSSAYA
jgi:hypothetical protein